MTLQKLKYGDNENKKCDFRGWFHNFVEILFLKAEKLSKHPPNLPISYFFTKIAISDDLLINFRPCLLFIFGEMGENSYRFIQKIIDNLSKDPRKTRNEFSLVRKQELDFSGIFWYVFQLFPDFFGTFSFFRDVWSIHLFLFEN